MDAMFLITNSNIKIFFSTHASKQFLDTSWVSYNSTRFGHCLSGDGVRSHRSHPYNLQMPIPIPEYHLCFLLTFYRSDAPTTSSLGLLEWLRKLRETLCLPDPLLVIKGYNSGTPRWKRCTRQSVGKGHRASSLSLAHHSLQIFTSSTTWTLSKPSLFGILWSICYIGKIG